MEGKKRGKKYSWVRHCSDQWPRSSLQPNCLSRSVDFTETLKKPKGSCNSVARALHNSSNSMIPRKISVDSLALPSKVVSTTMIPKREQITRPWMFGMTPTASSPRGASIARGLTPSRGISPSGRMVSPLRVRKKEKSRENGGVADDPHLLKLLHNRLLQWRFANARASPVFSAQKMTTEKRLYNSWISISKLYDSVRAKRIKTQRLQLNLKLRFILNRQMENLEEWLVVERDYVSSLVGAAEGLKGSTLCLPVDCVAKVNGQSVKDAISSAVDVMQAMASSICMLLPKVGKISCLAADLARVNIKEQEMLDVSRELLNTISALQVTASISVPLI
uniref:QWRF motif-containing protein n=1 Tax=Brassica campestris TaxID=3711 RepID=M4EXX6_BRACM